MVTELKLTGYELLAYALVHQMTQAKAGQYTGGVPYLAAWLGCSGNTARKYLHKLESRGLIKSYEGSNNGVPFRFYQVIDNQIPKNFEGTPKKLEDIPKNFEGDTQKIEGGILKNFEVNNKDKKENKIIDLNTNPPTPLEVVAYCREIGFRDPAGFTLYYLEEQKRQQWKKKNGEPIVNWKNNVRVWWRYHKDEVFPRPASMAPRVNENTLISYLKNEKAGTTNAGL